MTARSRLRTGAVAIAGLMFSLYTLLGSSVSRVAPGPFDRAAEPLAGEAVPVAWVFTESCLWPVLVTYGILALLLAARSRAWRSRALFSVVLTVTGWQISNVLKDIFKRPRPPYWVFHHETTFAYSSGHAMFATIVYGLWAYFVFRSTLPSAVRFTVAPALAAWALLVIWSRLALGAHYPTDLIGGVLLGTALLGAGVAVVPRVLAVPSATR